MFSCSVIYILSPLRTIFSPPTNQTTLIQQIGWTDHFPRGRYPNQAIFLTAYLQTRPFSSQQTSSPDLFPRSRPQTRPFSTKQTSYQTIFHEADLRPDHDQTTYLPAYQWATTLHRTPNFQTSRSDRFFMGWVKGG